MSENKRFNTDKIINVMGAVANNRYLTEFVTV